MPADDITFQLAEYFETQKRGSGVAFTVNYQDLERELKLPQGSARQKFKEAAQMAKVDVRYESENFVRLAAMDLSVPR